jgi:hypothetical protein
LENQSNYLDILPTGVQINFGTLRCYDGINLDDDLLVNAGVIKIDYSGTTTSPSITLGTLANGFYYSNLNTISLASNNIEILRMIYNLVECLTDFKATSLTTIADVAGGGKLILTAGSNSAPSLYMLLEIQRQIFIKMVLLLFQLRQME